MKNGPYDELSELKKPNKFDILDRMLFNPLFGKSKIYVFDVKNEVFDVYDQVNHCFKTTKLDKYIDPVLYIIPDKSNSNSYLAPAKEYIDENNEFHKSYPANIGLFGNKNLIFDLIKSQDKSLSRLLITESNKLRNALVTSTIEIKEDYTYIVCFVSEILFKSPTIVIKGTEKDLEIILNNIEDWLFDGIPVRFNDNYFELGIETTTVNGKEMPITQVWENVNNIVDASLSETIYINPYGDVCRYVNKDTGITMEIEDGDFGNEIVKIFVDNILVYKYQMGDSIRQPITEEFMQQMLEEGIYRKDPETNNFYIDDIKGNRVITISFDNNEILVKGPEDGKRFLGIVTEHDMQFFSKKITVMQNATCYTDTFTLVDNGVVYYSDYNEHDYLYYRDIFGIPYLRQ